ncbi:MAG: hypothetical protein ACRDYU_01470, partial [Actinomycetes bacterium]
MAKVEKGGTDPTARMRPLGLDEAAALAGLLGVDLNAIISRYALTEAGHALRQAEAHLAELRSHEEDLRDQITRA